MYNYRVEPPRCIHPDIFQIRPAQIQALQAHHRELIRARRKNSVMPQSKTKLFFIYITLIAHTFGAWASAENFSRKKFFPEGWKHWFFGGMHGQNKRFSPSFSPARMAKIKRITSQEGQLLSPLPTPMFWRLRLLLQSLLWFEELSWPTEHFGTESQKLWAK